MCGIIGIISTNQVSDRVINGLQRLEYRGYDSAGIATINQGEISVLKAQGKLYNLREKFEASNIKGTAGIGHIRWATHGAPTLENAHPHTTDKLALVHNGIIENYAKFKTILESQGYKFETQTDTEVLVKLIDSYMKPGIQPIDAVKQALAQVEGAYAIGIIFKGFDNYMICARHGSPLVLGYGDDEMFVGSDSLALLPYTKKVAYLEEGDIAEIRLNDATVYDSSGAKVLREVKENNIVEMAISKDGYKHFMLKEIFEQPKVIQTTLDEYLTPDHQNIAIDFPFDTSNLSRITIVACGTSYYAGMVAKYWIEQHTGIPVEVDIASEFRYRNPPMVKGGMAIFISQSGETADTLAAHQYAKKHDQYTIAIVNVQQSSLAREADKVLYTLAGPEIGVASTKAFTAQLTVLACLSIALSKNKELCKELLKLPSLIQTTLGLSEEIKVISESLINARDVLYLGRGSSYPIALEGALKLKEISYIHAEGYAAGELKHGPIALIDEEVPIIVLAPSDQYFDKTVSNLQEAIARGGKAIVITDKQGADKTAPYATHQIILPNCSYILAPLIYTIPVQLISYYTAALKGTDVDQPRNLAKSVTVE